MSETKELKKRIQVQLKTVKPLLPRGLSKQLMEEFNVSQSFVYTILLGQKWSLEIAEKILQVLNPKKVFDIENFNPNIQWDETLKRREVKYLLRGQIQELKPLLKRGIPQTVAAQFNVPESMVYDIMEGRSWHLEVAVNLLSRCLTNKARAEFLVKELQKIIDEKRKATSS